MAELFTSAAYRVATTYSVAFALAMAGLGTVVFLAFHRALLNQLDNHIANEAIELAAEYRSEGLTGLERAIAEREQAGLSGELGYALFDADGRRVAGQLDTPEPALGAKEIVFLDPLEGPDPGRAEVRALDDGWALVVAADLDPLEQINATMFSLLLAALAAVAVIGVAGALLLGAYLRKRLGRISTTAQAIMVGDLTHRMPLSDRNDEFDRLAASLNAMLDRIAALMESVRQVSNDVAHDLRTPLSRLRTRLEKALYDADDPVSARGALEDSLARTDEVLGLFSAILRIAEIESQELKHAFLRFDLSQEIEELCQSFALPLEDSGRMLHWHVEPGIHLHGDRELLAQALVNLLENAQKHTPPGTHIAVTLEKTPNGLLLTVADDGPGVSQADRDRLTHRFVRLEQARSTPGNGLGLNMVAAIASLHRAELRFADNHPGLVASLLFRDGHNRGDARPIASG